MYFSFPIIYNLNNKMEKKKTNFVHGKSCEGGGKPKLTFVGFYLFIFVFFFFFFPPGKDDNQTRKACGYFGNPCDPQNWLLRILGNSCYTPPSAHSTQKSCPTICIFAATRNSKFCLEPMLNKHCTLLLLPNESFSAIFPIECTVFTCKRKLAITYPTLLFRVKPHL